ncbi:hypothetical protein Pla175_25070 [Pirellulimonas nuda]|uniref:Leucine Rich repeats (2 copies) n=1 Tax=Pirellulimonas nuda TaxID=2528009 RepID=A0A518DCA3_9BACT|nr:hypothetical protein Pla175_25070 [Pirellulimonas nuda]
MLQGVGKLRQLESLTFYTTRVDCEGLEHLAGLQGLANFGFWKGDRGEYAENYSEACIAVFAELPSISSLNLHALPLSAAAIDTLPVNDKIKRVSFGEGVPFQPILEYAQKIPHAKISVGTEGWKLSEGAVVLPYHVKDDDLRNLRSVRGLLSLRFAGTTDLTDAGLAYLVGTKLKQLSLLNANQVTDAGIEHVSKIRTLESLDLRDCSQVTDASIEHLRQLPNLRTVKSFGTRIDRDAFKAALPQCEIE